MGKKLWLFITCALISTSMAFAQKTVTGTVIEEATGEPVIGASVLVEGTLIGQATDINGKFTIKNVPNSAKSLKVTYVGLRTAVVSIASNVTVKMESDAAALDEVFVVAYGSQKKASFTGSASVIKSENIENLQVSNISKALEGQVAGVQVSSSSGTPGSAASILVRGIGSISASTSPLIVVDGTPYEGSLNSINPLDIESMTILKDAAANSMYGARGANGVIMITTKGGKAGETHISFDARWGFNTRGVGNYDIITDAGEYYEMMYEAYRNSLADEMGIAAASQYAAQHLISDNLKYNVFKNVADDQLINPYTGKLNSAATEKKWSDDWTSDPFENGFRQEYNASVSGGSENTKAYLSVGRLGDEGYVPGSGFTRTSARLKIDQNIGSYFRAGGNIGYAKTDYKTFGDESSNYSNIFMFSQSIAPIYPIYLYSQDGTPVYGEDGSRTYDFGTQYNRPYSSEQNPLAVANANINRNTRDNVTTRGYIKATFLNDFEFTANIAYDVINENQVNFATPIGGDAASVGGRGDRYATRNSALNANQILDWNHSFGDHNAHVMLVHENKQDQYKYMWGEMTGFSDYTNPDFANAALYQGLTSYTSEYALEGYLAKLEYNYADKYYFTSSIRRDGSSRFSEDNRWGTFAAVGGAWRVNEEKFMDGVKDVINNLKIKVSYGSQGNDDIGYAKAYSDLYSVGRLSGGAAAFTKVFRGNSDLTWEKQTMFNAGFELGLFNRINVNFDFFIKRNNDLIYASPLPTSEGSPSSILKNEVDMKNTGFEIEINANIIKNNILKWDAALNLTHYKNELVTLPSSKPKSEYPDGFERGYYWWKEGGSIYNWSGYEYVGVDPETGLPQYNKYTTNEDGSKTVSIVNTTSEATIVDLNETAIPDLTGGLSTTLTAYGFDLSIQTAFQLGGKGWDFGYASLMSCGDQGTNFHKDMFNRWTPENTDTDIPALNYQSQSAGIDSRSDFFMTSLSYFSLRNVTLGYTLPKSLLKSVGIEKLRVYFAGDNMWLKSARKGFDPRYSFSGSNYSNYSYSAIATYSLGINLTF